MRSYEFSTQATRIDVETAKVVAVDCNTIEMSFDFDTLGSDNLTLKRLSNIQGRDCQ
jgi:hypothetical protein